MGSKAAGKTSPDAEALRRPCRISDERIQLRGRPQELVGVVSMQRGPVPISAFKSATTDISETEFGYLQRLHFAPLISTTLPAEPSPLLGLSIGAAIAPDSRARVPVRFAVGRTTPPGKYEAVFDVGGHEQAAEIEVLAEEALEILPRNLSISGPPGGIAREQVILRNTGNTRLTIDVLGLLVLQEEQQICLSLQHALAQVKPVEGEGAHRVFLDALATSLAERKTDLGRVRVEDGPRSLEPGDADVVMLAFHLPRDMIAGRQYRALLKAGSAQLFVKITAEPGGKAGAPSSESTPRNRRGKRESAS